MVWRMRSPLRGAICAPVVRVKAFQLLFLGVELRRGGFLGLRCGKGNSYEQEKNNRSAFHTFITTQEGIRKWSIRKMRAYTERVSAKDKARCRCRGTTPPRTIVRIPRRAQR